jgi:nitrite reductase (NO-forming)
MPERLTPPLLSDLIQGTTTRRRFLAGTAAVSAVAAACGRAETDGASTAVTDSTRQGTFNSNSRADTALALEHGATSHAAAMTAADAAPYRRYDPALPPLSAERTLRLHWIAREQPVRLGRDLVVAGWTFEGDIPGPIVHVRQGDTVEFTLTNEGAVPHSMDFHAAQLDPKVAFRSVPQGESVTFTFRPRFAGAFMYHCGTAPVLMHIGTGMYGAIIVSPTQPLPDAREFVLVQSELYLEPATDGLSAFSFPKMMTTMPDRVVFNGRPDQYMAEPIRVKRGDRVRFYVVTAGPTHPCAFHIVGEQFEKVYLGAPPENFIQGVQTFSVPAGGGMIFEFVADVEGEFPFVNHGFGHGQKGAIGFLVVEP